MEDSRSKNLFWLLSEDYNINPNLDFITKENVNSEIFQTVLFGFAHRFYDMNSVMKIIDNVSNKTDIFSILMIILENNLKDKMLNERNGLEDFDRLQKLYYSDKYYSSNPRNISEELEKYHYTDKPWTTTKSIREILMLTKTKCNDSLSLINLLIEIINKYFYSYKDIRNNDNFEKIKKEVKPVIQKTNQKIITKQENVSQLEKYSIGSQEFTEDLYKLLEDEDVDNDSSTQKTSRTKDVHQNIERLYGKSIVDQSILNSLKNKLSTDIHSDINFHIVNANSTRIENYRTNLLVESYNENIKHFEKNILIYNRQVNVLSEMLKLALLKNEDDDVRRSTFGTIDIKRAWRHTKLNDNKIFNKIYKNENSPMSVDLLLDMSASQSEKKEIIAAQAYVIAKALSDLSIKVRVLGFQNMYDYLIITKFKDYDEQNCKNIFHYHPEGSNRDGLALKFMRNIMTEQMESKLLIMLTDGKPNNIVNLNFVGKTRFKAEDYVGELAVKDSAKEVFLTRMQKIKLLGVFTGSQDDLTFEKEIFTNDFCYIKSPEMFSKTVGSFIKNIISNM